MSVQASLVALKRLVGRELRAGIHPFVGDSDEPTLPVFGTTELACQISSGGFCQEGQKKAHT